MTSTTSSTTTNQISKTQQKAETNMSNTAQYVDASTVKTSEEIALAGAREALARFSDTNGSAETTLARHKVPENKVSIPETMTEAKAAKITAEAATAAQEEQDFSRQFKANPFDGAVAFQNVLKNYFGSTGRPVPIRTMFGEQKPQTIEVEIGYDEVVQVTWGQFKFAMLEGVMNLGMAFHEDYGHVFKLTVTCPKKYAASVEGLFKLIDQELKENSIYKGKAIRVSGNDSPPRFLDLQTDPTVVYNADVYDRLDDAVWAPLRHTQMLRNDPETKIDPRVLLFGPYGTGKSECGRLTARVAVDNGWTFISFDSGKGTQEDLRQVLQTAKLFAPSVVFVEDIDIYAESADSGHSRSRLLEMFDGISSKNHEVLVVMTSNKAEKLDKGMLRPGRIDDMIEIGALDRQASETLIRKVNDGQLADDVDFDTVYEAVAGFAPAFLRRTFVKARQRALVRTADELKAKGNYTERRAHEFKLTTEDFVSAAGIMSAQHLRHEAASDEARKVTIDDLMKEQVAKALAGYVTIENGNIGDLEVTILEPGERPELV